MEDKKIIFKLQTLKQIKPNQEWVSSLKNEILTNNLISKQVRNEFSYNRAFSVILNSFFPKKLAYVVVAFLFVVSGLFGFVSILPSNEVPKITDNSSAGLTNTNEIKSFSSEVVNEVKVVVGNLTKAIKNNPKIAKDVALELKNNGTLASLSSNLDLQETSNDLYKVIIEEIMKDLEDSTLNENQQNTFNDIKKLYEDKKYFEALEKVLSTP